MSEPKLSVTSPEPKLKVISQDGIMLTSDITEPFLRCLSTLGDGVPLEKAAENLKEAFRRICDGEADSATVNFSIKVKKSTADPQMFTLTAKTALSVPNREYTGVTFVSKNYEPARNRDENTLYHSRG